MFLKCLCSCSSMHTSSSQTQRQYPTVIEELCHQFSLADLRKSTNNFDENRVIGQGRFGKVYKGYLHHNHASDYTVAIKRMDVTSILQGSEEVFKNEIKLLCQLRHPNLITLIGFCNHKTEKIIVNEYMSNRSLYDQLLRRRGDMEALSWKKRLEICIGAARGLHYLHAGAKHTILHRDLKPHNILLDHNMEPKLANFAFSLQGPHSMSKPKPFKVDYPAGTFGYTAMECFTGGTITDKCDVYSYGIVLLQVVCGGLNQAIYLGLPTLFEENIDPNIKGKIALDCWEVFMDITKRCLKYEPDERPTIGEVEVELEHALSLQEEADIKNTEGDYILLSKTIIKLQPESELEDDPSLHKEADII